MKRMMIVAVLLCTTTPLLQAQGFVKLPGKAGKQAKRAYHEQVRANSAVTHGRLSHYGGAHGALNGVDYSLARRSFSSASTPAQVTAARAQRSLATQALRNIKAWNLHSQRRKLDQAALQAEIERKSLEQAKAALPKLQHDQAFVVANLNNFIPAPQQPRPLNPFVNEPGTIAFRGLALSSDGNSIRNILVNGLRLQDVGNENSTLRIAYASPGGYYAIRFLVENPVNNLTYGFNSAVRWGSRRLTTDLPILTVAKVRGEFDGDSMETVVTDIPASDIEEMVVRLNIRGNLTWCKIELNTDGTFTITPYERTTP